MAVRCCILYLVLELLLNRMDNFQVWCWRRIDHVWHAGLLHTLPQQIFIRQVFSNKTRRGKSKFHPVHITAGLCIRPASLPSTHAYDTSLKDVEVAALVDDTAFLSRILDAAEAWDYLQSNLDPFRGRTRRQRIKINTSKSV